MLNVLRTLLVLSAVPAPAEGLPANDFLFLLDEAYLQEPGEVQVDAAFSVLQDHLKESEVDEDTGALEETRAGGPSLHQELDVEYGLADWLQIEGRASGERRTREELEDGVLQRAETMASGRAGAELQFRLLRERGPRPAVSLTVGFDAPFGEAELRGASYEAGLAASKDLGAWILHLNAGGGLRPGAYRQPEGGARSPSFDLSEASCGAAAVRRLGGGFKAFLEARYEGEEDVEGIERAYEWSLAALTGLSYERRLPDDGPVWELGAAPLVSMSPSRPAWGGIMKLRYEFDL